MICIGCYHLLKICYYVKKKFDAVCKVKGDIKVVMFFTRTHRIIAKYNTYLQYYLPFHNKMRDSHHFSRLSQYYAKPVIFVHKNISAISVLRKHQTKYFNQVVRVAITEIIEYTLEILCLINIMNFRQTMYNVRLIQ